jgi:predicted metal-dependent hydrolase
MAVKQVTVPELGIVHLYKRRGVRSIRLSITHEGEVRVSLPYWVPYAAGAEFARSKRDWILAKQVKVDPLKHGGKVGKTHTLSFLPELNRKSIATRITKSGEIRVYHPAHLQNADSTVQKAAERASIRALKKQAENHLPGRLDVLARAYGFSYGNVSIKQLKSRWGSCTDKRDIALNCYLMQLPWDLIDYVLLHELTHTKIMAHGSPFWDELGQYVPNLREVRRKMKTYRPVLLAQ